MLNTMEAAPLATMSFRSIVAGLFCVVMAVAGASLLLSASTNRNNEGENPPTYDCGTPLAYVTGSSRQPWRVADSPVAPTTVPGDVPVTSGPTDRRKVEACQQAMAPRLGFTTWTLVIGLVVVAGVALLLPAAAEVDARHSD